MKSITRAYLTGLAVLIIGGLLGNMASSFWLHILIYAPFVLIAAWLIEDVRLHSDFVWWIVGHPREGRNMLILLLYLHWRAWKLGRAARRKKKEKKHA